MFWAIIFRTGAQQIRPQAVELELNEYFSQQRRLNADGRIALAATDICKTNDFDGNRSSQCSNSKGTLNRWWGTHFPFCIGSTLLQKNDVPGGGITIAIPQRCFYLKDGETLKVLVGHDAHGLSARTVSRLKSEWSTEYQKWRDKHLENDRWVYIWAVGIYSGLSSEQDKLYSLVIIGVKEMGQKQFLAIEDGAEDFTQS